MNRQILTRPILGACIAMMAFAAQAQSYGTHAANTAPPPGQTATHSPSPSSSTGQTAAPAQNKQRAASRHESSGQHKAVPEASNEMSGDTAYRSALRSCVQGPEGQRDSCLDGAIARFGRS